MAPTHPNPLAEAQRAPRPARLLVGLGGSPFAERLITTARDLAAASGATWIAVHVETPYLLSPETQQRLDASLTRARELGAEIIVTRDLEIAPALLRVARSQAVTDLVVGQSRRLRLGRWQRPTLAERLVRHGSEFSVHVVPADPSRAGRRWWRFSVEPPSGWMEYGLVLAVITVITLGGLLLPPLSHLSVGLLYLLAVIGLSLLVGRWPVLLAGVLSAVIWEYIFIPPRFSFALDTPDDRLLFGTYFVVALVAGQLTARIRTQALNEHQRERRATALLELTRLLAEAPSFDNAVAAALREVDELFGASTLLVLAPGGSSDARPHPASGYVAAADDARALAASMQQCQPAGRFTAVQPNAEGYYLPLQAERGAIGVLGVRLPAQRTLSLAQRDLIEAFARQLAVLAEREELRAASEREKLLAASEKLHRSLFDSVSHELRTPLAVIDAALDSLEDADGPARRRLVEEVRIAVRRLNRLVANLLDQTRLESGALKPRLDWCHARDVVNAVLDGTRDALGDHPIEVRIPDDLPPIRADFALMEHALMNLVLNAAVHTPPGTPVSVSAAIVADHARFVVADRGPGFPAALRDRMFRKFSRGERAGVGGLGLGLSIVRGLVTAQGGEVTVGDLPGGGAVVTIQLPHVRPGGEPGNE